MYKVITSFILKLLYTLIGPTLKVHPDPLIELNKIKEKNKKPLLFAVWHDQTFICFYHYRNRSVGFLRSTGTNGEILGAVAKKLGYTSFPVNEDPADRTTIRSTVQFIKHLRDGNDGVFAVDGPLGPYHIAKPGIIELAQKANATLIGLSVNYSCAFTCFWRWDKYKIPLPFSKITITVKEIEAATANSETLTALLNP